MKWDKWVGSEDGRPTMWTKFLVNAFGCRLDLHKMVRADDLNCFHTHPAIALRIILWGGYIEEHEGGEVRMWLPGYAGFVYPETCHRVVELMNDRVSYSIWLRFRKTHKIELHGKGWPEDVRWHSKTAGECTCDVGHTRLGPCIEFLMGSDGRCAYCNHTESCH